MARHTFVQMTTLRDVQGRIGYITSVEKQEYLYATYDTAEPVDEAFWEKLAEENQKEFRKSGTEGKCIEARELIIALPENYTEYNPESVLREFTDAFKNEYCVECVSALHHNKTKTNYHIHLIFSERQLLPEPEIKIATRNMFYDETGRHVRTKKEITDTDGNLRSGSSIIKKGEVYEQHLFGIKDPRFKGKEFLAEAKQFYTELINSHIKEPEKNLKVYSADSVYLPTKKIGKNNPKEAEIKEDNQARQAWNRTADVALVSGVPEEKVMEVKHEDIQNAAKESVRKNGWLPGLFRMIIHGAMEKLKKLIREYDLPSKPIPKVDIDLYNNMVKLYKAISKEKDIAKKLDQKIISLNDKLSQATGIFKSGERKQLHEQIARIIAARDKHEKAIDSKVRKAGYPDVQTFLRTLEKARPLAEQYARDLKIWKEDVAAIKAGKQLPERQHPKPEKESIRAQLARYQEEAKRQPARSRKIRDLER